jgi:hypothetical protein
LSFRAASAARNLHFSAGEFATTVYGGCSG